jgi:hypothetical protein
MEENEGRGEGGKDMKGRKEGRVQTEERKKNVEGRKEGRV